MEYIVIIIICILSIFALKFAFQVKIKDIKKIKQIGYDKTLNEITNKLPENKEVCKQILKKLGNDTVLIEESKNNERTLTYYSVMTNHIIIAGIKDTFTRIQTIAHECLHSVQNRNMLMFNFIFSNVYIIYFIVILILTICKVILSPVLHIRNYSIIGLYLLCDKKLFRNRCNDESTIYSERIYAGKWYTF